MTVFSVIMHQTAFGSGGALDHLGELTGNVPVVLLTHWCHWSSW